jgi:hypothetical protein
MHMHFEHKRVALLSASDTKCTMPKYLLQHEVQQTNRMFILLLSKNTNLSYKENFFRAETEFVWALKTCVSENVLAIFS